MGFIKTKTLEDLRPQTPSRLLHRSSDSQWCSLYLNECGLTIA